MTGSKANRAVLITALLIIILSGWCITGISAYFMAVDGATNEAGIGNSDITVKEVFRNPDIEPDEITEITKQVNISNTGINYSGVRVRTEFSDSDILDWASIEYNTEKWTRSGDFWYYNEPLAPGRETEVLFSKITCNNPSSKQVSDFDVFVFAESRNCDENDSLSTIQSLF